MSLVWWAIILLYLISIPSLVVSVISYTDHHTREFVSKEATDNKTSDHVYKSGKLTFTFPSWMDPGGSNPFHYYRASRGAASQLDYGFKAIGNRALKEIYFDFEGGSLPQARYWSGLTIAHLKNNTNVLYDVSNTYNKVRFEKRGNGWRIYPFADLPYSWGEQAVTKTHNTHLSFVGLEG